MASRRRFMASRRRFMASRTRFMASRTRFMASREPGSRAGFVLAGGRSSRMGQDKALLPWKGSTLIESVAREVFFAAGNVTLIGDPERYGNLGFPVISDRIAGCGPLGGLHTALSVTTADWNVLVACDMPAVTRQLLEELLAAAEASGADALVPQTPGGLEPLCAAYHARLLPAVESAIQSKLLKMHDFVSAIQTRLWPAPDASLFRSVNTPEQLTQEYRSGAR